MAIEGAIEEIPVDLVIVSVGVSPNPLIPNAISQLETSRRGTIVVDESTMQSSLDDLYAGGDIVRGGATVILAMGDGRRAAASMAEALTVKKLSCNPENPQIAIAANNRKIKNGKLY